MLRKLLLLGFGAALLVALAAGTASANRLAVNEDDFLIEWDPLNFSAAGQVIECDVTLHGSFHSRTITKNIGSLIGHITRAIVNNCLEGDAATVLTADLPWHVVYGGILGSLPNITAGILELIGAAFRVDPAGGLPACLAETTAEEPGVGIGSLGAGGAVTSLTADESALIDLSGGILCELGGDSSFSGEGAVHNGNHTGDLDITLV